MAQSSTAETALAKLLKSANISYARQYKYVPGRKFEADFAILGCKLIIEVDGGIYSRRAHGSISGIIADMKRTNYAAMNGWRVMRYQPVEIAKEPQRVINEITQAIQYINGED